MRSVILLAVFSVFWTTPLWADFNAEVLAQPRLPQSTIELRSGEPDRLSAVPDYVCYVQNLQTLILQENNVAKLETCLSNLGPSLRTLQIVNNPINALGDLPLTFPGLETLLLEGVPLGKGINVSGSDAIRRVQIDRCEIGSASLNINMNPNLQSLTISSCNLTDTAVRGPQFLGGLSGLEFLSLRNNQLTAIPTGLPFLLNLRTLDLSGNAFTDQQKALIRGIFANREVVINF